MVSQKLTLAAAAAAAALFIGQAGLAQQQPADQQSNPAPGVSDRANQLGTEAGKTAQDLRNQGESAAGTATGAAGREETAADRPINQLVEDITKDPKTAADKLFVLATALSNRATINLSRQVANKSQNEQVKKQAQQLAEDLQKENQQLMQTAQAIGLQIPPGLRQEQTREIHLLSILPADQLDKRFTAHVQARNARELSRYQSEAAIGEDPQVKQWAQQQIQSQQMRSQQWNQVAQGMGMPGGAEAQPAGATINGQGAGQQQQQQQPDQQRTNENR